MPSTVEDGVEWLHAGALAPRTTKGEKRRGLAAALGKGMSPSKSPSKSPVKWAGSMSPMVWHNAGESSRESSRKSDRKSDRMSDRQSAEEVPLSGRGRAARRERRTPTGRVRNRSRTAATRRQEAIAAPTTTPYTTDRSGASSAKTPCPPNDSLFSARRSEAAASDGFDSGRRILGVKTPAPKKADKQPSSFHSKAPGSAAGPTAPFTPLPAPPPGEVAILSWIRIAGLENVPGLADALFETVEDLNQLRSLTDKQILTIVGGIVPKLRVMAVRKVLAAVQTLRDEASAFKSHGRSECALSERCARDGAESPRPAAPLMRG
jgi:hypothetical protein